MKESEQAKKGVDKGYMLFAAALNRRYLKDKKCVPTNKTENKNG